MLPQINFLFPPLQGIISSFFIILKTNFLPNFLTRLSPNRILRNAIFFEFSHKLAWHINTKIN